MRGGEMGGCCGLFPFCLLLLTTLDGHGLAWCLEQYQFWASKSKISLTFKCRTDGRTRKETR
jgi:hypothetical protein